MQIASLTPDMDGTQVFLRARVQTSRAQGSKMVFFNLRQRIDSIQALLTVSPEKVSKQMAKWAAGLAMESIVLVEGTVKKTPEPIKSATVQDVEIHISQVRVTALGMSVNAEHRRSRSTLSPVLTPYCRSA